MHQRSRPQTMSRCYEKKNVMLTGPGKNLYFIIRRSCLFSTRTRRAACTTNRYCHMMFANFVILSVNYNQRVSPMEVQSCNENTLENRKVHQIYNNSNADPAASYIRRDD